MAQWFSNVTVPSSSVVNTNERCPHPSFRVTFFCDGVRLRRETGGGLSWVLHVTGRRPFPKTGV